MKHSRFIAVVLIVAMMFGVVGTNPAKADVTDVDKDDDGDIDLMDVTMGVIELAGAIYDWWTEPSPPPQEDPKPEPKKEESSWWPF